MTTAMPPINQLEPYSCLTAEPHVTTAIEAYGKKTENYFSEESAFNLEVFNILRLY